MAVPDTCVIHTELRLFLMHLQLSLILLRKTNILFMVAEMENFH